MYQRVDDNIEGEVITFNFNGQSIHAAVGDTVASALLMAGMTALRATPSGEPRGPYCLMGACYDCLVDIDGKTVQACMTPVSDGMVVARVAEITGQVSLER